LGNEEIRVEKATINAEGGGGEEGVLMPFPEAKAMWVNQEN
jgi:hypothetical protein